MTHEQRLARARKLLAELKAAYDRLPQTWQAVVKAELRTREVGNV